jgi:hypothetical protein
MHKIKKKRYNRGFDFERVVDATLGVPRYRDENERKVCPLLYPKTITAFSKLVLKGTG